MLLKLNTIQMNKIVKVFIDCKLAFKIIIFLFSTNFYSQQLPTAKAEKGAFWEKVQFGGGFGLGIGSGFTNILVAPSAIYNVNKYFSGGLGLQYSY